MPGALRASPLPHPVGALVDASDRARPAELALDRPEPRQVHQELALVSLADRGGLGVKAAVGAADPHRRLASTTSSASLPAIFAPTVPAIFAQRSGRPK